MTKLLLPLKKKKKKEERKYGIELLDAGIKDIKLAEMSGIENAVYREPVKKEKVPEFEFLEKEEVSEEVKVDIENIIKKEPEYMEKLEETGKAEAAGENNETEKIEPEAEQEQEQEQEKISEESASAILEELSKILAKNSKK